MVTPPSTCCCRLAQRCGSDLERFLAEVSHRGRGRLARPARRGGHAADPARRQGPGVPGRLPRRVRGRPAAAADAGQAADRGGGGRGAPAVLRRPDPGAAAPVPQPTPSGARASAASAMSGRARSSSAIDDGLLEPLGRISAAPSTRSPAEVNLTAPCRAPPLNPLRKRRRARVSAVAHRPCSASPASSARSRSLSSC